MSEYTFKALPISSLNCKFRVYVVINIVNGHVYVGKESGPLGRRRKEHCLNAESGVARPFASALRIFGPSMFWHLYVFETDDKRAVERKEREFIELLQSNASKGEAGYNANGGMRASETSQQPSRTQENRLCGGRTPVVADESRFFFSVAAAARFYGVYAENISACTQGKRRRTGGHTFRNASPYEIQLASKRPGKKNSQTKWFDISRFGVELAETEMCEHLNDAFDGDFA